MTSLSQEIEALKPDLVNRVLTNVYHTKLSERYELLPGVSYVLYFRTIIELDHDYQFDLWKSYLSKWKSNEELFTVRNEQWDVPETNFFIGQKLKDIIHPNGQIILIFANDIAIEHTIDYGDGLKIKPLKELIAAEKKDNFLRS